MRPSDVIPPCPPLDPVPGTTPVSGMLRFAFALFLLATSLAADVVYSPPRFTDPGRLERLTALFPEIDDLYRRHATNEHIPGLVYGVLLDGQLVHVGTHGIANRIDNIPVRRATRFRIASMSKSFTAMAILKLRDTGRLQLDDPVEKHLQQFRKVQPITADSPRITLRHLLQMDVGFPQDDPWGDRKLADTVAELEALVAGGLRFSNPPGTIWEYSNLGYGLLGHVITRVSGRPYQDYITREILRPLGMTNTVWEYDRVPVADLAHGYRWEKDQWRPEPLLHDGTFGAMGGLITTLDDFARYVAFHLDAWPPRDDLDAGPVRRASRREMHQMHVFIGASLETNSPVAPLIARGSGYGYGLSTSLDTQNIFRVRHAGGLPGYGSEYRFVPDRGIALIAFANRTYAPMTAINSRVLDVILQKARLPQREIPVSPWLARRSEQLLRILQDWSAPDIADALAPNVFMDRDPANWQELAKTQFTRIGNPVRIGPVRPLNQLRGRVRVEGGTGSFDLFFTLTPEAVPRIQDIRFETP